MLSGWVVNDLGAPVDDFEVRTVSVDRYRYVGYIERGPGSLFAFTIVRSHLFGYLLPPGEDTFREPMMLFHMKAAGHVETVFRATVSQLARLQSGRSIRNVRITLPRAASLRGRILSPDGEPVTRARAAVVHDPFGFRRGSTSYRPECAAQSDGGFIIEALDPARSGDYWVVAFRGEAFCSEPVPLRGRLVACRTTELDLKLVRRNPVELEFCFTQPRRKRLLSIDRRWPGRKRPVMKLQTRSGPHRAVFIEDPGEGFTDVPFRIPEGRDRFVLEVP